MKHNAFLALLPFVTLVFSCGGASSTEQKCDPAEIVDDKYVDVLPTSNWDNGLILHAFGWSFNQIREQLPYIAESGFRSIQTMPLQQPKDNGSTWWSFYQPLSFSIADNSTMGTKAELVSLCEEAEEYGISIIADVVFNHLANIGDEYLEDDGTPMVSPDVERYEPEIYAARNASGSEATFHHVTTGSETQYYPYGKLPDLNTGNALVQSRALAFLKECIDAGVDGFRFDAAKHIETPEDPQDPSSFWPNTLGKAAEYYEQKFPGKKLFAYGEILGGLGGNREISSYTKYMKVTEDSFNTPINNAVFSRDAEKAMTAKLGKVSDPSYAVTWVESHDSYIEASTHINNAMVISEWAMNATRKKTNALFLARPDDSQTMGYIANYTFENPRIAIINNFKNRFMNVDDLVSAPEGIFVNEKIGETDKGAIIANLSREEQTATVAFQSLPDGAYCEQVSGKTVQVCHGKASIDFDSTGVAVLVKTVHSARPFLKTESHGKMFVGNYFLALSGENLTYIRYKANGGEAVDLGVSGSVPIHTLLNNGACVLEIEYGNAEYHFSKTFTFTQVQPIEGYFNVFGIDPKYFETYDLYYWAWSDSGSSWLNAYELRDGVVLIDFSKTGYTGFLIALFPKGYVIADLTKWDSGCAKKTGDIKVSDGFYDASTL